MGKSDGKKRDKSKFVRLKALRCFQTVHEMLSHGYPAPGVARFIQSNGEYRDVGERSLAEQLKLYRSEILPVDILTTRIPHVIIEAKKQYTDKLEDLRRLDDQYEAMKYRFDAGHAKERMGGYHDPNVDRTGKSVLDLIWRMHAIRMDLGISGQRQLGSLTVSPERLEEIRQKYGEGAARAMADPVSRARVLAVLRAAQDRATMTDGETEREIEVTPSRES